MPRPLRLLNSYSVRQCVPDRFNTKSTDTPPSAGIPFIQIDEGLTFDIENPATPHILLKGIQLPFGMSRHYDMKLIFEKSGPIDVTVSVGM